MNMNARRCWLIAGLAIGTLGSSAIAQVAPPPTQPSKEETKYEPPVKKVAPAPTAQPEAKPAEAQPKPTQTAPTKSKSNYGQSSTTQATLPTSTPYPKLITKDENGKVVRLIELPDILAFRSNPTIGQKSVEAIMPILYGRRARFERLVIDSLDLYWMVTDGRLDTMNLNEIKSMAQVAEMIKPLVGRTTLSQELQNRGILTRVQGGMNSYIVNEYKQAITTEIQFEHEDPLSEVMRFVLKDSIHETVQAYRAMLAESSNKVASIVEDAGLASPEAQKLAKLQRPLNEDPNTQRAELAKLDQAFRALSIDDGIAFFTAMRNQRKNPDFSPAVRKPNVMHARKVDISDTNTMEGKITYKDGREYDTKELKRMHDEAQKKKNEEFLKEKEGND